MKKKYEKPVIIFEDFKLYKSIATGCEQISNAAQGTCQVYDPELNKTYISENTCPTTPPGGYDSICYHAPIDSANVFNS